MNEDDYEDIEERLLHHEDMVTETECLELLSYWSKIPTEQLEARLARVRGDDLLVLDCDLPMTGLEEDDDE